MTMSRKTSALIVIAVFVGVIAGLIIASDLDWTRKSIASNDNLPEILPAPESEALPQETTDARTLADAINNMYVGIVDRVSPAVVTILSERRVERRSPFADFFGDQDLFRRFFDYDVPQEDYLARVLGSGVIVQSDGHIITNYHVIKDAVDVKVTIGEEEYDAEIIGTDPKTDVGVLKIEDGKSFPYIRFGDSDKLSIGEQVLAFGTPLSEQLDRSVSKGIVSAKGRARIPIQGSDMRYQNFIQTDAAINPGNSGGPLVNLHGELVGINTAIVGQYNMGIGFAIPVNMAKWVMDQLIEKGEVTRGWLGVIIQNVDPTMAQAMKLDKSTGVIISEIAEDSPAEDADLMEGDVILKVDNKPVANIDQLSNLIARTKPGTAVTLQIIRDGKTISVDVKLGTLPGDEPEVRTADRGSSSKLGFSVRNLTEELADRYGYEGEKGVIVTRVERGTVAEREGLPQGSLIKEVNYVKVSNVKEFEKEVEKVAPGDAMLLRVQYQGRNIFIAMKMPND